MSADGIDASYGTSDGGLSLLALAAERSSNRAHEDCALLLLSAQGIDLNRPGPYTRRTPLIAAVTEGAVRLVEALLATGSADINQADEHGGSALMAAARLSQPTITYALLRAEGVDVDVNHVDLRGISALAVAAAYGRQESLAAIICAPGVNVNAEAWYSSDPDPIRAAEGRYRRRHAMKALGFAVVNDRFECVKLLLRAPTIQVNRPTHGGRTPLWQAVTKSDEAIENGWPDSSVAAATSMVATLLVGGGCRFATGNVLEARLHFFLHDPLSSPLNAANIAGNQTLLRIFRSSAEYWQRKHHASHSWCMQRVVMTMLLIRQHVCATPCFMPAVADHNNAVHVPGPGSLPPDMQRVVQRGF